MTVLARPPRGLAGQLGAVGVFASCNASRAPAAGTAPAARALLHAPRLGPHTVTPALIESIATPCSRRRRGVKIEVNQPSHCARAMPIVP